MVGSRPDEFATLEDAVAYRRQMSPIVAGRRLEDQEELALGVLRRRADGAGSGRWSAVRPAASRAGAAGAAAPLAVLQRLSCPTLVVWGEDSDVLSEPQARRMAETLPKGQLVSVPGVGHAPTLVNRSFSQHSAASWATPDSRPPAKSHRPQHVWPAQSRASIVSGFALWLGRMIDRYTRPEMGRILERGVQVQTWLRWKLAVCEAYARRGRIPSDAMARIRGKARVDIGRILAIQERVKHEMIALLTSLEEQLGEDSRFIHIGLTTSDVWTRPLRSSCEMPSIS